MTTDMRYTRISDIAIRAVRNAMRFKHASVADLLAAAVIANDRGPARGVPTRA